MFAPEEYLMLSGIQHFMFCRRQWALIHVEGQWEENLYTARGQIAHKTAHGGTFEKRGNMIITRSLPVVSHTLGLQGVCDVVEFLKDPEGVELSGRHKGLYLPVPVEYKAGEEKENPADRMQLCAQAVCLEEMLLCDIPQGYLFYEKDRRRVPVTLDEDLRRDVREMAMEMHSYFSRGYTPKVKLSRSCRACSLQNKCLPFLNKNVSAGEYIAQCLREDEA